MSNNDRIEFTAEELRQKINLETAQIGWDELTRHFARGVVIVISPELDLIDVAIALCADDKARFEAWTENGMLHRALDDDARRWNENNTLFWSTVVAPWVLVQEIQAQ